VTIAGIENVRRKIRRSILQVAEHPQLIVRVGGQCQGQLNFR
jgi:hypothetical protein